MPIRIIAFGELSIQLIFPFLVSIFRNLRSVVLFVLNVSSKVNKFPFFSSVFMSLSQILGGLLEFIICFQEKKSKQEHEENIFNPKVTTTSLFDKIGLKENKPNQLTIKSSLIILLITVLGIMENNVPKIVSQYVLNDITNLRYQLKIINIFFIAIISIPILHYPLFRHQYCSIAIIVIGLFFLLFQTLQVYYVDWYITASLTLCYSLVSIQKVCEKYLMHYKYFSPYRILLYEGALGMVLSIIIEIVLSLIPCPTGWFCQGNPSLENPLMLFWSFDLDVFLYIFSYLIFVANLYLWSILTNKYFTPTHIVISDIFSAFLYWCTNFYYEDRPDLFSNTFIAMSLIGFIITMFGTFMYTEIVIVYLCELGYYTKAEIQKRCKRNYEETVEIQLLANLSFEIIE